MVYFGCTKVDRGHIMAKRWSFNEDYIVGKFCSEDPYMVATDDRLLELIERLDQAGVNPRSRLAVKKRLGYFTDLFLGFDMSQTPKQVRAIYEVLNNEGRENHLSQVLEYINNRSQCEDPIVDMACLVGEPDDLSHMVHTAKGRKFIDVLEDYIQNSGIRPKSRIYNDVGMKQETYSAIRRGKYKTVSRENVYRLCFGLRLNYDDATKLMGSCGLAFRGDSVLDAVVEYFLKQGPTKGSVNRLVKKENKPEDENTNKKEKTKEQACYIYDTILIDADLVESKVPELFWGFCEGDDRDDD